MSPIRHPGDPKLSDQERLLRKRHHYTNVAPPRDSAKKTSAALGGRNLYPRKAFCVCDSRGSYTDPEGDIVCIQCGLVKI